MSFSETVRNELCSYINDKDKRFACLYGMLLFCRELSYERIIFQSRSETSANTFEELFRKVFKEKIQRRQTISGNKKVNYIYEITDKELIKKVYAEYHITPDERHIDVEIIPIASLGVFTAGAFLAGGSVNDPSKEYHLEFISPEKTTAEELISLLSDIGVSAGLTSRRNQYIIYIKGSECIEDTLTFIGAQQCTLEIMNIKIYKDVRNKVNRIANCDNANINKTVEAALKQIEDIRLIDSAIGLENLPDELRELAELRLENDGSSLKDLGESLSEPISRSGVNHRLKKIAALADDIRMRGGVNEKQ